MLLFTWAFPRMVGLLAALLEVCLPGLSGWCLFRVTQILWFPSLPKGWSCFWFWHSGTGVAPGNVPYSHHGFTPGAGSVLSVSAFSGWFSVLKVLVLKCQVLPVSWALTLLACCLGLRGSCPVVTLPGMPLWFFRTWWGSVELLRTSGGRVFCLIARLSPGLGLALVFWVFHVWVFSGSPSGSECSVLSFRHVCDVVFRDLPCSSVGGLHCTGPANARQIAWEKVIACGGGQVFLVR